MLFPSRPRAIPGEPTSGRLVCCTSEHGARFRRSNQSSDARKTQGIARLPLAFLSYVKATDRLYIKYISVRLQPCKPHFLHMSRASPVPLDVLSWEWRSLPSRGSSPLRALNVGRDRCLKYSLSRLYHSSYELSLYAYMYYLDFCCSLLLKRALY